MNKVRLIFAILGFLIIGLWVTLKIFVLGISFNNLFLSFVTPCPYGHWQLKAVPIGYGLLIHDKETDRALEELEFAEGGCMIYPGAPSSKIICKKCRFEMDNENNEISWRRNSYDITSFERPITDFTLSMPIISPTVDSLLPYTKRTFWQTIINDSVIVEGTAYTSASEGQLLYDSVLTFCQAQKMQVDTTFRTSSGAYSLTLHHEGQKVSIDIWTNYKNLWNVRFCFSKRENRDCL